jgi:hypothetical protein
LGGKIGKILFLVMLKYIYEECFDVLPEVICVYRDLDRRIKASVNDNTKDLREDERHCVQ